MVRLFESGVRITQPLSSIILTLMGSHERDYLALELIDSCASELIFDGWKKTGVDRQRKALPGLISLLSVAAERLPIEGRLSDLWCFVVDSLLFCGRHSKARTVASLAMRMSNPSLFNRGSFANLQFAHGRTIFASGEYGEAYRVVSGAAHLAKSADLPDVAAEAAVWAGIALLRDNQDGEEYHLTQYPLARNLLEQFVDNCRLVSTRALGDEVLRVLSLKIHGVLVSPGAFSPDLPTDEPDTVRLWRMVGQQYLQCGQPDAAGALLKLAEDATTGIWGRGHPEMAETLADLSEAEMAMGHGDEADRNAIRALRIASRTLGRKHPLTARLMKFIGDVSPSIPTEHLDDDDEEFSFELEGVVDNDP